MIGDSETEARPNRWSWLVASWFVVVLGSFVWHSSSLVAPTLQLAVSLGWAVVTLYAIQFSGFRLARSVLPAPTVGVPALERSVLEFGFGTSLLIGAMFLGGILKLYGPWFPYACIGLALVGNHARFLRSLRVRLRLARRHSLGGSRFLLLCLLAVGSMTLLESLAPATSQDALVYHLAIPQAYVEQGGIVYLPTNFFAQFPQNIELLFTYALLLGQEPLAGGFHWLLGAAAACTIGAIAKFLRPTSNGLLAACCFVAVPTAALIAGWAYVDLGVVYFGAVSTLCFLRWVRHDNVRWLVAAGIFAGVTAGIKYTGGLQGLQVCALVCVVGWLRRYPVKRSLGLAAGVAALVGLVASPWWIKNLVCTGNPLFPFAYGLFGGADWDAERDAVLSMALGQWGGDRSWFESLLLPWRLTMDGEFFSLENFDGVIGAVFLMGAPLVLRSWRGRLEERLLLVMIGVEVACWILMTHQIRFLLPALALLSVLIAVNLDVPAAIARAGRRWTLDRCSAAGISAALAFNVVIISLHFGAHNPLSVVLGLEDRHRYLDREVPGGDYAVFRFIEEELPDDAYILFGSLGNPGYLCKRRYHSDAFFENFTLNEVLVASETPAEFIRACGDRGFTHFLFRWENVFDPTGKRSEISVEDQKKLATALNQSGKLVAQKAGTMLYALRTERGS